MTAAAAPGGAPAAPAPTNGAAKSAPQTPAGNAPPPATSDGKQPAQAKPPEQPWKAKRKLVIGGKEVEREYDDRRLQILEHQASQQAEFQRQKAEFDARLERLTSDPDSFFQESQIDLEGIIEARRQRAEQLKQLSPDAKRAMEAEEKLKRLQDAEAKRLEQEKVQKQRDEDFQFTQRNVQRLGKAMELSGLPRSGEMLKLYAEVQELAIHAGEPEMEPAQLAQAGERLMAKKLGTLLKAVGNEGWRQRNAESLKQLAQAVLPALEGEPLLEWVGKENATRIVKALHARTRTSPTPIIQEPPPSGAQPVGKPANGAPTKTEWDILDGLSG